MTSFMNANVNENWKQIVLYRCLNIISFYTNGLIEKVYIHAWMKYFVIHMINQNIKFFTNSFL